MDFEPQVRASDDPDHRAGYLSFAIAFGLRGLWPVDIITVHGPHHPEDYIWGEAEVRDERGMLRKVTFRTSEGSGRAISGIRVSDEDSETFPRVHREQRTVALQQLLEDALDELRQICASAPPSAWLHVYCGQLDRLGRAIA